MHFNLLHVPLFLFLLIFSHTISIDNFLTIWANLISCHCRIRSCWHASKLQYCKISSSSKLKLSLSCSGDRIQQQSHSVHLPNHCWTIYLPCGSARLQDHPFLSTRVGTRSTGNGIICPVTCPAWFSRWHCPGPMRGEISSPSQWCHLEIQRLPCQYKVEWTWKSSLL